MARWFDLAAAPTPLTAPTQPLPLLGPGRITLFTGPSGSGKSLALRRLMEQARRQGPVIDIEAIPLPRRPCVDQFGRDLQGACDLLCRVGLGEARTWLLCPHELSDGQRWRLRLARGLFGVMRSGGRARKQGMAPPPALLASDEFCAVLDRVSAAVVARCLRRTIDRLCRVGVPVSAAVATSHDDLEPALLPDEVVRCDFEW